MQQIIANLINMVLVLLAVEGIKYVLPFLNSKVPWLLPIIAGCIGPVVAVIQGWLGALVGLPIDLSAIVAIFTGSSATALHQVFKQMKKSV